MDLEDAAVEALAGVRELEGEVDLAVHALDAAEEHLRRVDGQIEADWVPVANDAQELLRRIEEEQSRLSEDATEATGGLDALAQAVRAARDDGEETLSEAAESLEALRRRIADLESSLGALFDEAEAAAHELESLAIARQRQMESVVAKMTELLEQRVAPYLQDVEQEFVEWKDNLERYVAEMWVPLFDDMARAWEGCLTGGVGAVLAAGLDKATQRAQAMVAAHAEQCRTRYGDALEEIGTLHGQLAGALQKLETAIEGGSGEVLQRGSEGAEELARDGEGLEALQRALEAVRERLASFSFVRM